MTENQPYECITCMRVVPTLPGVRPHPLAPCVAHVDPGGLPCSASREAEIFPRVRVVEWGNEFVCKCSSTACYASCRLCDNVPGVPTTCPGGLA